MSRKKASVTDCPCGSGFPLSACCAPFIAGLGRAPSALALMRSRYTAYRLGRSDYLLETWYPATRPPALALDAAQHWLGLKILGHEGGESGDASGNVEFVARYRVDGRAHRVHENSRFLFEDGRWFYVDGKAGAPGT